MNNHNHVLLFLHLPSFVSRAKHYLVFNCILSNKVDYTVSLGKINLRVLMRELIDLLIKFKSFFFYAENNIRLAILSFFLIKEHRFESKFLLFLFTNICFSCIFTLKNALKM